MFPCNKAKLSLNTKGGNFSFAKPFSEQRKVPVIAKVQGTTTTLLAQMLCENMFMPRFTVPITLFFSYFTLTRRLIMVSK